ncbi:MAG: hypothetical protein ACXVEF_00670 [Polyangiales bacterium]
MAQIYVMVPGNPQPQLLEIDEVARRIKAGELPDSSNVARLGETNWVPAKDLPEVAAKLADQRVPSIPGTSTSLPSMPGTTPAISPSQAGAPSPFGASPSVAGTPSPFAASPTGAGTTPAVKSPGGLPKGALIGAGAALGVLFIGVVSLLIYRNSYSRGLVLEHLPEDCAEMYYVDVAGIATSDPVKSNLEKFIKNTREIAEDEVSNKSKKEKERFTRALEALQKNGVEPTSIREIAMCQPIVDKDDSSSKDRFLIVIGGTFRKGDVLQGVLEATEAALKDEEACKMEDDDVKMVKCSAELKGSKKEPIYGALLEGRVLAISGDKKLLKSVRANKDRSKTYGANKGEMMVHYRSKEQPGWDGSFGDTKLKIGGSDTVITIETHYDPDKGKKQLAQFKDGDELVKKKEKLLKDASDKCFEKTPFEPMSDAVENTKVEVFDDGIRYEYKVSNKDLGKTFKSLADADKDDLGKFWKTMFCVQSTVEPFTF